MSVSGRLQVIEDVLEQVAGDVAEIKESLAKLDCGDETAKPKHTAKKSTKK